MNFLKFNLRESCHVNTNEDGDRFVGVKIDQEKARVYFPLGYNLPYDDRMLRKDIRALFNILSTFEKKEDKILKGNEFAADYQVEFPILAFLDVMDYYMENNGHYYTVTEKKYRNDTKGKFDFKKTVKRESAFIKDGSLIFTKFQIEYQSTLENELITRIHKYCVYQSFQRLGWLYTNQTFERPNIDFNKRLFIEELRKHYRYTNKDRNKKLFKSMIDMIEFINNRILDKRLYFGTDNFEYIWEKLIDKVFGIINKDDYFPKATWTERHGTGKATETHALMPDTIMIYNDKIYILDAKYYRYGVTHNPLHLPDSSSINKQITYGEYINHNIDVSEDSLLNAFIMPFNMFDNKFESDQLFLNVAEAKGKWRENTKMYENIQSIVVDVRYLLLNYVGNHDRDKQKLAESIEKYMMHS